MKQLQSHAEAESNTECVNIWTQYPHSVGPSTPARVSRFSGMSRISHSYTAARRSALNELIYTWIAPIALIIWIALMLVLLIARVS